MPPKYNRTRALFVLTKIDEILAWEQRKDTERDTKFVELGRYLCEVRAGHRRDFFLADKQARLFRRLGCEKVALRAAEAKSQERGRMSLPWPMECQ